ncbi:MAG: hypothetical protein Q9203_007783, partial [Teloschistes exilis]
MSQCCISGFAWDAEPQGKENKLGSIDAYITDTPENKDIAIMIIADIFGWTFNNTRVLADHFAKDVGATVFVPDLFVLLFFHRLHLRMLTPYFTASYDGEVVPEETLTDPEKRKGFDIAAWAARNSKENRGPTIFEAARALKQDLGFKKVGAVGYCYGGWAVFQLGAK